MTYKARYMEPTAKKARSALIDELSHHGFNEISNQYEMQKIHEKHVAAMMGKIAYEALLEDDDEVRKIAQGIMLLAVYMHEGKHDRPLSIEAIRLFWFQLNRAHPGLVEEYLTDQEIEDLEILR